MCVSDLSSCNLIGLASSLAIAVGENLTSNEVAILGAFFTAFADNLAIIASTKARDESQNTTQCPKKNRPQWDKEGKNVSIYKRNFRNEINRLCSN